MTDFCKNYEQSVSVRDSDDYDAETQSEKNISTIRDRKFKKEYRNTYSQGTKSQIQKFLCKMYVVTKEVIIIFCLVLAYAALTNEPWKVMKSPVAFPFFARTSVVKDWYNGELSTGVEEARKSDLAFVMFYAPWDGQSQIVKYEFELTAKYMQKRAEFAAINCWQPGSECRGQYNKAFNWPILIAYLPHGNGIQYKGPQTAHYMMKFLVSLSRPLVRLSKRSDVHELLGSYDAVVLGCVNALPGSLDYSVFYSTALRFLERDPLQEIVFAVLTGHKNDCIEDSYPKLLLYMWNETLIYPTEEEWRPDSLLTWIYNSIHQVSIWMMPTGSKSLALNTYIQPGPTMILFTPRNPLAGSIDYYDSLREIATEYYSCNKEHHINSLLIHTKRLENLLKYKKHKRMCSFRSETKRHFPVVSISKNWDNDTCAVDDKLTKMPKCKVIDRISRLHRLIQKHKEENDLSDKLFDLHNEQVSDFKYPTFMIKDSDLRSPKNLKKFWKAEKCRLSYISEKLYPTTFSLPITNEGPNILGLSCKTNQSLTFIALDSVRYYQFAERLGIDTHIKIDKTAAIIINQKMELHYILNEPVGDANMRHFIYNFTAGTLSRSFESLTSIEHPQTHIYSYRGADDRKAGVHVMELNSKTFLPTITQKDKAVMVFYYSKQCSFCNGISYVFLTVANLFSSVDSLIFTRIDGDLNILPWEFTMDSYPTIIYIPRNTKSESRVYPSSELMSVPNLVTFILANLDPNLKIQAMWNICNRTKSEDTKRSCVASVRAENLSIIDDTLRLWRKADVLTKTKLLYKLQKLRNINMLLSHSPQNTKEIRNSISKLHTWSLKESDQSYERRSRKSYFKDEL